MLSSPRGGPFAFAPRPEKKRGGREAFELEGGRRRRDSRGFGSRDGVRSRAGSVSACLLLTPDPGNRTETHDPPLLPRNRDRVRHRGVAPRPGGSPAGLARSDDRGALEGATRSASECTLNRGRCPGIRIVTASIWLPTPISSRSSIVKRSLSSPVPSRPTRSMGSVASRSYRLYRRSDTLLPHTNRPARVDRSGRTD